MMVVVGSRIEAVIYGGATRPAGLSPGVRTMPLPGGLTMVPITDEVAALLRWSIADGGRLVR